MAKNDLEIAAIVGRVFVPLGIVAFVLIIALSVGVGVPSFLGG